MSELTPDIAADVVAACQAGAEEAAGALGRALDGEFSVSVGEAGSYAPEGFGEAGLAVLMKFGDVGVVAILPESSGMLPDWIESPDPTGESKLSTLAQELSKLLVPERLKPEEFQAAHVAQLAERLSIAKVTKDAALVPLELKSGEQTAQLSLIWPLESPEALFAVPSPATGQAAPAEVASSAQSSATAKLEPSGSLDFSNLPSYSRSLLKIQVPVRVVLASRKENLQDIVELATGTIIKFDKACDELLHLHVGDQPVAEGEAVKVGDKFGLRVMTMLMPEEHFLKAKRSEAG
jgi:flagellar motor switch protein FliN/FliY